MRNSKGIQLFLLLFVFVGVRVCAKNIKTRFLLTKAIQSHPKLSLLSQNTIRLLQVLR